MNLIQTECKTSLEYGLNIPLLSSTVDKIDGENLTSATPHELAEYAGMLALGCDLELKEYLNTWSFTGETMEVGSAVIIRLKGLFSCDLIKKIFKNLQ